MSLNSRPLKEVAYAALGLPVIWVAHSTLGEWPETGVTMSFDGEDGIISFAPTSFSVDGMDALWNLTAEQIATLDGITSWRIQVNGAWPLMAGFLSWGSGWTGVGEPQILGSVIVGPSGQSAYDVAVFNGFEGTEQQWLDTLSGFRAIADPDNPDLLIVTYPTWALDVDGSSILIPILEA